MQINLSSETKIGNMSGGGGLSAIFDGSNSTVGYAQQTVGFAGVSFAYPRRIDYVECVSADNGFDASGLTTGITLQLYAKNGAPPASATDGTYLGDAVFTDQNSVRTIKLTSSDKVTEYAHVWVRVVTGVWAILSELRMFEAGEPEPIPEPEPVAPLAPGSHLFMKSCNTPVPLTSSGVEISETRIRFELAEERCALFDFHADVTHTGSGSDASVAVGFSFWIVHRHATTEAALNSMPWTYIPNAVGGGNVSERNPQHYGNKAIVSGAPSDAKLQPGFHEISVVANGHTDGSSTQGIINMLVEGGKGLNCLRVTVLP